MYMALKQTWCKHNYDSPINFTPCPTDKLGTGNMSVLLDSQGALCKWCYNKPCTSPNMTSLAILLPIPVTNLELGECHCHCQSYSSYGVCSDKASCCPFVDTGHMPVPVCANPNMSDTPFDFTPLPNNKLPATMWYKYTLSAPKKRRSGQCLDGGSPGAR